VAEQPSVTDLHGIKGFCTPKNAEIHHQLPVVGSGGGSDAEAAINSQRTAKHSCVGANSERLTCSILLFE
jgi:putative aminopeptidase FrvX